ncbi:porin family protein [Hymenobacter guriensis]|uniref:PorT family protein n=1 Tax=Hymenobacter guriensis TaxID=2793065 RepID=A0ABS0KZ17_9BACT|nr:porin family protein [Hymenobacter guriensis]MBG8553106.1 PorT family protein [Hymenobacter guriensis]
MKKLLFTLLGALLACSAAQAQIGIKGGVNAAVLDGQDINQKTDYQLSYHAGLFYVYNVVGPLSIRPELLYSVQGSEFKQGKADYETKLQYVNLPILFDLKLSKLHLQAGPQFGLLLTAKEVGTVVTGYDFSTSPPTPTSYGNVSGQVKDKYNSKDFSLCAGLELELAAGLRIGGRFNAGLTDIADYKDISSANDARLKNRVIQAYAAFQLGK